MPVSILCGIGTPIEACHNIKIAIEPCILGMVDDDDSSAPCFIASSIGLIPSIPTAFTLPTLPASVIAAAMTIGTDASQHK